MRVGLEHEEFRMLSYVVHKFLVCHCMETPLLYLFILVFSICCYSSNRNTSFEKIFSILAIAAYDVQSVEIDRQTNSGDLVIGSRLTLSVRNPKIEFRH